LVSDWIIANANPFCLPGEPDQEKSKTEAKSNESAHPRTGVAGNTVPHLNLREALEWLLGAPHTHDDDLSHEEKAARRNRRMELLLWLLNLEPRLAPYGE
jgi:hypothetical protein